MRLFFTTCIHNMKCCKRYYSANRIKQITKQKLLCTSSQDSFLLSALKGNPRLLCTDTGNGDGSDDINTRQISSTKIEKDPELKKILHEITSEIHADGELADEKENKTILSNEESKSKSSTGSSPISEDEIDKMMSQYNIEEFYGLEATVQRDVEERRENTLPISLQRGVSGVYDIDEVVTMLRHEQIEDVCVIAVPKDRRYVDYMVIGTGRSMRHLKAAAQSLQWTWKKKRDRKRKDPATLTIEGMSSDDWLAMDMGNIALHLFLRSAREHYNLESLWTCGPEHDIEEEENVNEKYATIIQSSMNLAETKQRLIDKLLGDQKEQDAKAPPYLPLSENLKINQGIRNAQNQKENEPTLNIKGTVEEKWENLEYEGIVFEAGDESSHRKSPHFKKSQEEMGDLAAKYEYVVNEPKDGERLDFRKGVPQRILSKYMDKRTDKKHLPMENQGGYHKKTIN